MKRILAAVIITAVMAAMVGGYGYAQGGEKKKEPVNAGNTICPVMGTKITPGKSLTVEYEGKLYNVCCPVCIKEFTKSPKKYASIVEKDMKMGME